jgi:2-oxo-4-hydroxy-4-carboxy-5-ureidoimidazoline decarboxylase
MCSVVAEATTDEQLTLIRAHPDLVGKAVLTAESSNEQASAGLTNLTSEEIEQFDRYNKAYREKFSFPFVICARLNRKAAILEAFPIRLQNEPEAERVTALAEIYKIAELRLADLLAT